MLGVAWCCLVLLGATWCYLVLYLVFLGATWCYLVLLGATWCNLMLLRVKVSLLEASWGPLGDLGGLLEASWRPLGGLLEASWRPHGVCPLTYAKMDVLDLGLPVNVCQKWGARSGGSLVHPLGKPPVSPVAISTTVRTLRRALRHPLSVGVWVLFPISPLHRDKIDFSLSPL